MLNFQEYFSKVDPHETEWLRDGVGQGLFPIMDHNFCFFFLFLFVSYGSKDIPMGNLFFTVY